MGLAVGIVIANNINLYLGFILGSLTAIQFALDATQIANLIKYKIESDE